MPKSSAMMILSFELRAEVPRLVVLSSLVEELLPDGLAELVKRRAILVDIRLWSEKLM